MFCPDELGVSLYVYEEVPFDLYQVAYEDAPGAAAKGIGIFGSTASVVAPSYE